MKIERLIAVLPCSRLEDLRLDRNSEESEELLSACTGLWHPALIECAHSPPIWSPAETPPQKPAGSLIVLPECCEGLLPEGWIQGAEASGAVLLRKLRTRPGIVTAALDALGGSQSRIDADLVADFLALGYCRFVVELLTRKFRYMSSIDEPAFSTAVLAAAKAAADGDGGAAKTQLQTAFERLHQAREYFYPVQTRLIDLTLVAPTTLGESLRRDLCTGLPCNLLLSAKVLQEMARREPDTLTVLKRALASGTVSIAGGELFEIPLHMLSTEDVESHLCRGLDVYSDVLGRRPAIFARRRYGLTPALPQILARIGFTAAVHFTLDDGQFPTANQSRIQWEGFGGASIYALARIPLDANRADSFFCLPEKLGQAMEADQPATVVFAHWPGHVSPWYEDLARSTAYSQAMGVFCTLNDYFQQAGQTSQKVKFGPDRYRSPCLVQDVAANLSDPVSLWVRYFGRRATWRSVEALNALAALAANASNSETVCGLTTNVRDIPVLIEDSLKVDASPGAQLDQLLQQSLDAAMQRYSASLAGKSEEPPAGARKRKKRRAVSRSVGYLVANPLSFSQQIAVEIAAFDAPLDAADPILAAAGNRAVIGVPGTGFAWVGNGAIESSLPQSGAKRVQAVGKRRKSPPVLAQENTLRNDLFEAVVDPHTGAIRAIWDHRTRHPRLAQQIALRTPQAGVHDPDSDVHYSIMSADEIRITSPGPIMGEIVSTGKIVDSEGRRLAGFKQTARVWQSSRILELEIEIDADELPGPNPWNSYYACRFAWNDESSKLFRSVNATTQPTDLQRFESPLFVDVRSGDLCTTILCGGLPYHRRIGFRKLDTLLVVQGESARRFRLGVGIDLPSAMQAALGFLTPKTMCCPAAPPPAKHGWLFHIDHRNVIATRWEPLFGDQGSEIGGRDKQRTLDLKTPASRRPPPVASLRPVIGFRVRLLETEGRHAQVGLRSFRTVAAAQKIEPGVASPFKLPIEGDKIGISISPHQIIDVEALF
jgi:alpha-mannosidase